MGGRGRPFQIAIWKLCFSPCVGAGQVREMCVGSVVRARYRLALTPARPLVVGSHSHPLPNLASSQSPRRCACSKKGWSDRVRGNQSCGHVGSGPAHPAPAWFCPGAIPLSAVLCYQHQLTDAPYLFSISTIMLDPLSLRESMIENVPDYPGMITKTQLRVPRQLSFWCQRYQCLTTVQPRMEVAMPITMANLLSRSLPKLPSQDKVHQGPASRSWCAPKPAASFGECSASAVLSPN